MALTRPRYSNIVDTDYKASVRVITLTNITLSGGAPNVVDGLNLEFFDRILVAGQSTASENGIYTVQTVGTGSNGTWIRSVDAGASDRVTAGMRTFIAEGVYAGSEYRLVTPDPIILGNTSLSFQSTAATVAGVNKGVQYNNAGFIAGATNLVYDNISGNVVATATTTSTNATTGALVVVGGVGIGGPLFAGNTAIFNNDVTILGNLFAQGNTYITTSTDLAIQDSILNLHTFANLAPLTVNDGKDIGLKFHYYQGAGDDHAFIGRVNTTGYLEWLSAGEETSGNVFTGTAYGTFKTGNVLLVANTYRGSSTIEAGTQTYIPQFARSSTPPASPQLGDHWYDTSTDVLYKWFSDGTSSYWIDTLGTASTVTWSSQSTQPISPSRGDLWYDTSSDALYTYVFDGTSSYWVDYTSTPSSIAGIGALLSNVSVGNVTPYGNLTYNLGNVTSFWANTYTGNLTVGTVASDRITTANVIVSGDIDVTGNIGVTTGFVKYGVFTSTALNGYIGQVGWVAAVSDSPTVGGRLAFWDTTNSRWSYVSDNTAV